MPHGQQQAMSGEYDLVLIRQNRAHHVNCVDAVRELCDLCIRMHPRIEGVGFEPIDRPHFHQLHASRLHAAVAWAGSRFSVVDIVMMHAPLAVITAVTTWITPRRSRRPTSSIAPLAG